MFDSKTLFEKILFLSFGSDVLILENQLISVGGVNQGVKLKTDRGHFFLKLNFETDKNFFEMEAEGLRMLSDCCPLSIPTVINFGHVDENNFLLMDWVDSRSRTPKYWEKLGVGVAQLHMHSQSKFGLNNSNYISSLIQSNAMNDSWVSFFIEQRLEPLIGEAFYNGLIDREFFEKFRLIYPKLQDIFPKERPSLLHGDLWSGNVIIDSLGEPTLIDPAVYFGHREMDIAFSLLFGGFDREFYDSYNSVFPMESGFEERKDIYNLYPLLVHLLLFGKGYFIGIKRVVDKLLI
ncbi:fructosamine kinase family protein [Belliella sp. R4-6]|uniref:Fructosamine kinase family protein n=1 Tax=Belliella alkalica TaxID=1730871 RepID=A0ABS9VBK7_9BACT|nr:fructosamine kinase family protein [Belliella alkalica]MCH7413445.1 fructosamine kinase family protein [Belliella alkalica]